MLIAKDSSPKAEATHRYWDAALAWSGKGAGDWTTGQLLQELSALSHHRGMVGVLAALMLEQAITDERRVNAETAIVYEPFFGRTTLEASNG